MNQHRGSATLICLLCLALRRLLLGAQRPQLPANEASSEPVRMLCGDGIDAFRDARYDDAIASFRKAAALAPGEKQPHLYLGITFSSQVVPNLDTPENLKRVAAALSELEIVLKDDPRNLDALRQKAATYRNIKQLDKARATEKEVLGVDPKDAEAYYTIGVLNWTQVYKNSVMVLAKEDLNDDGTGNAKLSNAGCDTLEQKNALLVQEASESLEQAIRIRPNYDDAMQYLNLIYRRKAELHCHDRSEAKLDIGLAQQWNARAIQVRKENEAHRLQR